jgi:D-arabinose 1-dehydrogenase-like Zn-dependent alcohol dehydrogenase
MTLDESDPLVRDELRRDPTSPPMSALVQNGYGVERLQMATVPRPSPAAGEVLVDVAAAGLDRGVWHLVTGLP